MRQISRIALIAALLVGGLSTSTSFAEGKKTLYRWTDERGVVHFGDALPPTASKQQRATLQTDGRVKSLLPRELTEEEIAARDAAERAQKAQEARDRSLLLTYTDESGLENARVDHLTSVDQRITHEQAAVAEVRNKIAKLVDKTNVAGTSPEEASELSAQIEKSQQELTVHQRNVGTLQDERRSVDAQFTNDIKRFRELKGGAAVGSPPKP